jgi:transcriptional regulator with XRE-family HTH domain
MDLDGARLAAGLSVRELAGRLAVDRARVARALRGDPQVLTIGLAARLAATLGLELAVSLHPDGVPIRDKGHVALLERLRARLAPGLLWRTEIVVPLSGDRRSADAVIVGADFEIMVEAETRLGDVQALERAIGAKQRDLSIDRVILLVADTRHNRTVVHGVEELGRRFPIATRACLGALARGRDPGGNGLVIL